MPDSADKSYVCNVASNVTY